MLFVDSCDPLAVQEIFAMGIARGVTTNPLILAKRSKELGPADTLDVLRHLVSVVEAAPQAEFVAVFAQLTASSESAMIDQAVYYQDNVGHRLGIKVPFSEVGLRVATRLRAKSFTVNLTSVMTVSQAYVAAQTGAQYVSLFFGRIADQGFDATETIRDARQLLTNEPALQTQIIVGSIRQPRDVMSALHAGAHIVTASPDILKKLLQNPGTEAVNAEFQAAAKAT
jgi:transaldolase